MDRIPEDLREQFRLTFGRAQINHRDRRGAGCKGWPEVGRDEPATTGPVRSGHRDLCASCARSCELPSVAALLRPSDEPDDNPHTAYSHRSDQEHDRAEETPEGAEDHQESDGRQRDRQAQRVAIGHKGVSDTTGVPAQPDHSDSCGGVHPLEAGGRLACRGARPRRLPLPGGDRSCARLSRTPSLVLPRVRFTRGCPDRTTGTVFAQQGLARTQQHLRCRCARPHDTVCTST